MPRFPSMSKKKVEFTDSANTIYWPTSKDEKEINSWKKSFFVHTKYFLLQTVFVYLDTLKMWFIIYIPDLNHLQARREKLKIVANGC